MNTSTTTSQGPKRSRSILVLAGSLLAALAAGCTQTPLCPELGTCGGDIPVGVWELAPGNPSCSEDLYVPPTDTRLLGGEVPAARVPTVEPALFDWCYLLVAGGGQDILLKPPRFFYESGPVGAATVTYNNNGTFSAGLTRTGTYTLDFPATCMRAFGAVDGRSVDPTAMPPGPPGNVCKQLEIPLAKSGKGEGSYPNTICEPNPAEPQGCLCRFDVTETGGPTGRYEMLSQNEILHYSSGNFPAKVTFCNKGTSMQLTGSDGAYLFNNRGLRTMDMKKVEVPVCANSMQDAGEEGVDCGGTCPTPCAAPVVP